MHSKGAMLPPFNSIKDAFFTVNQNAPFQDQGHFTFRGGKMFLKIAPLYKNALHAYG